MNDNIFTIIMIGVMVGGLVGSILRFLRKVRPARADSEIQVGNTAKAPSLPFRSVSRRRDVIGFMFISLLVIVFGLTFGFIAGILSNLLYLVFLFPLLIGLGSGSMIADLIRIMKIRQLPQVVILSALSAAALYGMLHYGRYVGFVIGASMEISSSGFFDALEDENMSVAKMFLDYALEEETGHPGFGGYMLYKAGQGVSIGRLSRSSSFDLGPVLTWLYWLLELGMIFGLTLQKGKKMIGTSFCESCGNWVGGEKHLGGTASANESVLLGLIRQKNFSELGQLMEQNADVPSLEVYFQGCQVCGRSQSQLVVRHAFQSTKGQLQFTDASQTVLQPAESAQLLSQLSFSGD